MNAASRREAAEAQWAFYTDPRREGRVRSFFYVFGLAVQDPVVYREFLASLNIWTPLFVTRGTAEGLTPQEAADSAHLVDAAMRGLLMELMSTGDRDAADRAFRLLLDRLLPAKSRRRR
jgi:hypothetical protein